MYTICLVAVLFAAVFSAASLLGAPVYESVAAFEAGPKTPPGMLLLLTDGNFDGASLNGGVNNQATAFRVTLAGEASGVAHFPGRTHSARAHLADDGHGSATR